METGLMLLIYKIFPGSGIFRKTAVLMHDSKSQFTQPRTPHADMMQEDKMCLALCGIGGFPAQCRECVTPARHAVKARSSGHIAVEK